MACRSGSCDAYEGFRQHRPPPAEVSSKPHDEARFTELWVQIVMPKILEGKEFRWTELSSEELKRRSHNGDHTA